MTRRLSATACLAFALALAVTAGVRLARVQALDGDLRVVLIGTSGHVDTYDVRLSVRSSCNVADVRPSCPCVRVGAVAPQVPAQLGTNNELRVRALLDREQLTANVEPRVVLILEDARSGSQRAKLVRLRP